MTIMPPHANIMLRVVEPPLARKRIYSLVSVVCVFFWVVLAPISVFPFINIAEENEGLAPAGAAGRNATAE